jgi:hypothetical protein
MTPLLYGSVTDVVEIRKPAEEKNEKKTYSSLCDLMFDEVDVE